MNDRSSLIRHYFFPSARILIYKNTITLLWLSTMTCQKVTIVLSQNCCQTASKNYSAPTTLLDRFNNELRKKLLPLSKYPPHSPDLFAGDLFLFPNLKKWPCGKQFVFTVKNYPFWGFLQILLCGRGKKNFETLNKLYGARRSLSGEIKCCFVLFQSKVYRLTEFIEFNGKVWATWDQK